ncbi:MAG: TRL-like protein family [Cyanobacteria bacterium SIG30]|nr:TRL-like protein family [Cyanobacteria bacterium SIG30]
MYFASILNADAMGVFYTDATYPITATGTKVQDLTNLRKGQSSATSFLFLIETGDAGIDTAARNGGITKISYIDVNEVSVLFFFRKLTVTVYGE